MCMIFDMAGSGLAQMDMGLMRFIVNCFKIYFPNILALLLVYNMPWILQGQPLPRVVGSKHARHIITRGLSGTLS